MRSIIELIPQCKALYYQLMLIVAPSGAGKSGVLQEVQAQTGATLINVNLEISKRMLELTERQRTLKLPGLLEDIVRETGELVLLDNIELLFDMTLKQDPLRLLQELSRKRTVISSWNGQKDGRQIIYAEPGHPEYRKYDVKDLMVIH
jgi:hypothetical protein